MPSRTASRRPAAQLARPDTSLGLQPKGCTNLLVKRFDRVITRGYDARVAGSGLKNSQYSLLSHVVTLGPIRPGALARWMSLDASTMTRNLHALIEMGFVVVRPGDDARSRLVEATPSGRAKRAETQKLWKQAQLALNARLGDERVARLHALLDECLVLLEGSDDDPGDSDD